MPVLCKEKRRAACLVLYKLYGDERGLRANARTPGGGLLRQPSLQLLDPVVDAAELDSVSSALATFRPHTAFGKASFWRCLRTVVVELRAKGFSVRALQFVGSRVKLVKLVPKLVGRHTKLVKLAKYLKNGCCS